MRPFIYFTITATFWGLNFHFAKIMLQESHFVEAGFWRYFFGVVPLLALAYRKLPTREEIRASLKGIVLVGVICLFGFNFFFFLGLMYSPAINGSLIVSLTPGLTLLFSNRILKTPLRGQEIFGVFVSFLGVMYLILKGNIFDFASVEFSWGDILLVIATSFFGLQNVWSKMYGAELSNLNFTFFTNLFCMLSFLAVLPFLTEIGAPNFSSNYWLAAVGIGCFGTALAYLLWNTGIQLANANQAGIFINVVPLSTAAFSLVFGEVLYSYHLVSGVLVILGVIILLRKSVETDVP